MLSAFRGTDMVAEEKATKDLICGIVDKKILREKILAACNYAERSEAPSTMRAYLSDWKIFMKWCADLNLPHLPAHPGVVAVFLSVEADAGRAVSTVERRYAAIRYMHNENRFPMPKSSIVQKVLRGIVRTHGRASSPKAPLLSADLERVIDRIPRRLSPKEAEHRAQLLLEGKELPADAAWVRRGLADTRDRAILLLMFSGAARRSDVESMLLENIVFTEKVVDRETRIDGRHVLEPETRRAIEATIYKSKTNQAGMEEVIKILGEPDERSAYCPVRAVADWIREAKAAGRDPRSETKAPLFLPVSKSGRPVAVTAMMPGERAPRTRPLLADAIGRMVKQRLIDAKFNPAAFGSHSLRAGALTSCSADGADLVSLSKLARHKNIQTTMRYIRDHDEWRRHPMAKLRHSS